MSLDQYSETPASNYISGYFLTGMAPSSVKVAGSDIMADLASRFAAIHTTGGTATAYTLTQTRQLQALIAGLEIICIPNATCTGAATFAPDGLTAKNIFANGAANLAGQIVQNVPMYLKYDGTQWNLLNPQAPTGSYTGTITGLTTAPTGTINITVSADGKICYLSIPGGTFIGTSNATSMTITGGPTYIAPASLQAILALVRDNSTDGNNGVISIATSSTILTFGKSNVYATGGFTSSNLKGFNPTASTVFTFSYPLKP